MAATNPGIANLVEYYKFDDASFATAAVGVHAGKNLTTTNTPTTTSTSKKGTAIQFTRANSEFAQYDVAYGSSGFPANDDAFSVSFWARLDTVSGILQDLVGVSPASSGLIWKVSSTTSYIFAQAADWEGNSKYCDGPSPAAIDTWYHLVFYHDPVANEIGLVINDGTPITTAVTGGLLAPESDDRFNVGFVGITYYADGIVDELAFFDKVLSGDEIEWLYNSGNARTYTELHGSVDGDATGGTITYASGKTIHTFTSSGNFVTPGSADVDYLVVAGGGGGGSNRAGGGGGGEVLSGTAHPVVAKTYSIVIGDGGNGATVTNTEGANGDDSVFDTITATGGGGGGGGSTANRNGLDGGNGGGGGGDAVNSSTGGTGDQFNGGVVGTGDRAGGGGGGASEAGGGTTSAVPTAGDGGDGLTSSISGLSVTYGGGGGGGTDTGVAGAGGAGGGGAGTADTTNGVAGTANTGGGGGGCGDTNDGGNGGSGIVIISYTTGSFVPDDVTFTPVVIIIM